jgi:cation transport regulator ChaB
MYDSIDDLPLVCRINLPPDALQVYREAFNRAWRTTSRYRAAQDHAWSEVRARFEREKKSGKWIPRRLRDAG